MSNLISLRGVHAGYNGKIVVSEVTIDINENDCIAFIGPNGGGKTTILKVILGTLKPMVGQVHRRDDLKIGYLPQINQYDPKFPISVLDVVLSGQMDGNRLRPSADDRKRAHDLLKFAQLNDLANRPIGNLSGGQRQRAFLCRALMSNPQLLILDEPVTYMDKASETNLYKLLPELSKKMAIILVSHDIGTVSSYVKTIACINRGLYYHDTNKISDKMLSIYECPVELVTHGPVPHRVLANNHPHL